MSTLEFPELVTDFIQDEAANDKLLVEANDSFKKFIVEANDKELLDRIHYSCSRFTEIMMTKIKALHSFVADCAGVIIDLSDKLATTMAFDGYRDEVIGTFKNLLELMDQRCMPRDLYIIYIGGVAYIHRVQELRMRCLRGLVKALNAIGGSSRAKFIAASLPTVFTSFTEMLMQSLNKLPQHEVIGPSASSSDILELFENLIVEYLAPTSFKIDAEKDPHTIGRYTVAALITNIISRTVENLDFPALPEISRVVPNDEGKPILLESNTTSPSMMSEQIVSMDPRDNSLNSESQKKIFTSLARLAQCVGFVHPMFRRNLETMSVLNASNDAGGDLEVTPVGLALTVWLLTVSPDQTQKNKELNSSPIPLIWSQFKLTIMRLKAAGILLSEGSSAFVIPALSLIAASVPSFAIALEQVPANFANPSRLPFSPSRLLFRAAESLAVSPSLSPSTRAHGFKVLESLFSPLPPLERLRVYAGGSQLAHTVDVASAALLDLCRKPLHQILVQAASELKHSNAEEEAEANILFSFDQAMMLFVRGFFDDRSRISDSIETLTSAVTTLRLCVSHPTLGHHVRTISLAKEFQPQPYSITLQAGGAEQMPLWLKEGLKNAQGPMLDSLLVQKARMEREESMHARSQVRGELTTALKEISKLANEVGLELESSKNELREGEPKRKDLRLELFMNQLAAVREVL